MMIIGSTEWIDLIRNGASKFGLEVSKDQAEQFAQHGRWLMAWNRKINLTSITDPVHVAVKHFLDTIAPSAHIPSQGHLLDIGTGGGFPGIPLKIMRSEQPMTLIDSVRKKINFVKHVIRQLSLDKIEARHTRAESLAVEDSGRVKFHVIICRALADWNGVIHLAAPLLAPGGKIVLYQGAKAYTGNIGCSQRIYEMDNRIVNCTTASYQLPVLGDARCVTILKFAE